MVKDLYLGANFNDLDKMVKLPDIQTKSFNV